jgi:filamentous hemagglutinin family protein
MHGHSDMKALKKARQRLLITVSVTACAAVFTSTPAMAGLAALYNAAHVPSTGSGAPTVAVPTVPGVSPSPAGGAAMARSLQNASKAQQTVAIAQQAQTAARQSAAALGGTVPDGLVVGGLAPVANPVSAANDPTGLSTWQGANAPTQTKGSNGAVTVTVQQTAARAVLDWQTFNVGANTTLNFDQSQNGVAQPDWVVLNRVVGQIDPTTGLRNPNLAPAPSQILGSVKAQGTVLVLNQNGILFGPTAQINTNSLIATSLEIGSQLVSGGPQGGTASSIANRDNIFLTDGLLSVPGADATLSGQVISTLNPGTSQPTSTADPQLEGTITVQAGAQITSGQGGFVILAAPQITNSGVLTSSQGQVSLVSGRTVTLTPSDGTSNGGSNPDIRGLMVQSSDQGRTSSTSFASDYVDNTATGLIQSSEGYASLTGTGFGTIINAGTITATTSVSRNGFIQLGGANIELTPTSVIAITPDDSGTIPQDPNSLADFKPSQISIGEVAVGTGALTDGASIDIGAGSLIYAPSANINIGTAPGLASNPTSSSRVFIDSGAMIDASGLKNVPIAASTVTIKPVTANDTNDQPSSRNVLAGATITVDPRLSGVDSNGVAWVGSPFISAAAYAQQVGVTASQLMTKGGNVVIGAVASGSTGTTVPDVIVKPGATIDVSGGWVTFPAGWVQTTQLVNASGAIVDIGYATPDQVYLGVYSGFSVVQPRYGIDRTFANSLLSGGHFEAAYNQGGDAGSLTIKSSNPSLEGTIYGQAFPGPIQAQNSQPGTGTSQIFGDQRHVQAVGSQLPVGGLLSIIEVVGTNGSGGLSGGDINIVDGPTPDTTANLTFGSTASVDGTGVLSSPFVVRPPNSILPPAEQGTLVLSAPALNAMGLGQLAFYTSGDLNVDSGANVTLAPGGVFSAVTGRTITIDGSITAPSGTISLTTVHSDSGSLFNPTPQAAGDYDVVVNGQLSAAGLWSNDFGVGSATFTGAAYINGGSIDITVAPREDLLGASTIPGQGDIGTVAQANAGIGATSTTDISGSILIDGPNSLLDVSAGGYVAPSGKLNLSATGGNVTLTDYTAYFPFELNLPNAVGGTSHGTGFIPGFRVSGIPQGVLPINPSAITSQVAIADGAIHGYGFAGGGVFTLSTPAVAFADGIAKDGTNLPLDFFSKAGFGTYNITSYGTDLIPNTFDNGLGGYNAVLKTQILTVQNGQNLNLTQTGYSDHLSGGQITALRRLTSGGQVSSILTPGIQLDAFDQLPVSLNFGGLIEFEVAPGGDVTGAAGAMLSASQIYNQGTIRLPGGTLSQSEILPSTYAGTTVIVTEDGSPAVVTVPLLTGQNLSDIFSVNADGSITGNAKSVVNPGQTNSQIAANDAIYLTGDLPAGVGIALAPGSVTDLSGEVIVNPFVTGITQGRQIVTGVVVGGGTIQTAFANLTASTSVLFPVSQFETNIAFGEGIVAANPFGVQAGRSLIADPGATINISGAAGVFDQLTTSGQYVQTPQWSNGGSLIAGADVVLAGAQIDARGGAPQAAGGLLSTTSLTLTPVDPTTPIANTISAEQIEAAGFGTLVVQGDLTTNGGPVDLTLGQAFYLMGTPMSSVNLGVNPTADIIANAQSLFPTVSVTGSLQISAPYISLDGPLQAMSSPTYNADSATTPTGEVTFNAQALDVIGAVLFDQAVANVTLNASGDIRFIGVSPLLLPGMAPAPSLMGQLEVNGNLTLAAGQVYATTGSSFNVASTAETGVITIAATSATPPPTPFSAGSNLTIQAANIVQDGVLRAPVGSLALGSNTPLVGTTGSGAIFAPATSSVELGAGSVTSVSADGLSIPYGTTTDQTEYFFSPTSANALTTPPAGVLTLAGQTVTTSSGATVNLNGGGDVFAYEFIPGTGGSRDVLSQFNADAFSSSNGFQYPDHRQVYAIVPGLSNAPAAAYDPIYSSNYGALYSPGSAGQRVYLNGGQGVPAGWYTLLPAQYAVLPGGMEVVEDTSAFTVPVGASVTQPDGTVTVTGEFGGLGGTIQSTPHLFDIKTGAVINSYSDIALTSANTAFAAQAAAAGIATPRLPLDADRLVLNPMIALDLSGTFETMPASGGRGAEADISASSIQIVSALGPVIPGVVQLDANQLSGLNVASLLIGGVRTDNADGSTSLNVTAKQITVSNDAAHPLTGADVLLAADGSNSSITLKDGANITASGTDTTGQTGDYLIDGTVAGMTGQGALVRVSSGSQRSVTRENVSAAVQPGVLTVGAASLNGASVLLDSNGAFNLSSSAKITTTNLGLDAPQIVFAPDAQGLDGLIITPSLLASFSQAQTLTLRSQAVIDFADGAYSFGDLDLDTPGLETTSGSGAVVISAQTVKVQNTFADTGSCGGVLACGAGQFALDAQSLTFGNGIFRIYGAGQSVSLTAPNGVFFQGQGAFDVGAAPLSIQTAYLGDQTGSPIVGVPTVLPSLAITTTGSLTLSNPSGAAVPDVSGIPGATLTLSGQNLSITGVDVRATAGSLTLTSATGISVGADAILETPGFSKSFGDAADPFTVTAPGGLLTLAASNGDIVLAPGSTLSVGGGVGDAGSLILNASKGSVVFGGSLIGAAPTGEANFSLDEAGAFDLTGFQTATKGAFNGDLIVQTGAGDLMLASGQTITAANVSLTANGGAVDIAGTIDVSGINGGDIGLFGSAGVTLESTALIAARASGYGPADTRQATGGLVELGTAGAGALTIASGAVIDVSAANTNPRIVEGEENGLVTYNYVAADQGGTVILRAPVIGGDNAETVNVNFAGAIKGAGSVVLEGYRAYDLDAIASSGQFSGVIVADGVATLDTTTTGLPNFLADKASGTLVDFIQNFNVSSSYAGLGGLASQANFHARPGVELDYSGGITLASNWNFGAGTVNVAGAVAAGLMVPDPEIPGAYSVVPGAEGEIFANYTTLTYRVGGNVLGEPGVLTLKAGGQLNINGSITDGFFNFGDQTDPRFLITLNNTTYAGVLPISTSVPTSFSNIPGTVAGSAPVALIPYDATANAPGAQGSGLDGAGDPIGSSEIFPLVQTATGSRAVNSWSYQLTGGATQGGANPLGVQAGAAGGVTVQGTHTYQVQSNASFTDTLMFQIETGDVTADQFLAAEAAAGHSGSTHVSIDFSTAPAGAQTILRSIANSYFPLHPGQFSFTTTGVSTILSVEAGFLQLVAAAWPTLKAFYNPPASGAPQTATASTLIRTGTGSISLAAAGKIDLRNCSSSTCAPTYLDPTTGAVSTPGVGVQQGGAAIYTAGALVVPKAVTAVDTTTGTTVTLDPSAFETLDENIGVIDYGYGVSAPTSGSQGLTGVLVSNPVYANGGGNISLVAGGDILGRRDAYNEVRLAANPSTTGAGGVFIGWYDQPWRIGTVGAAGAGVNTNILVNPQLFTEGAGTLGGGDVTVKAGGTVSDLTVVADTSVTTGAATGGVVAGQISQGQLTFGGGNVTISAGGDLLGGRVDVASGLGTIAVGGGILSAGSLMLDLPSTTMADNTLRLRLADATIDLSAHGDVTIQGVAALGVQNNTANNSNITSDAYASNFYSAGAGVSVVGDGSITFANVGSDVLPIGQITTTVLPGSLAAVALEGNLNLNGNTSVHAVLLDPSDSGTLILAAGADITPVNVAMLDSEPGSNDLFPVVLPSTTIAQLQTLHDPRNLHQNDPIPNRIYAGGDIENVVLSTPKQTRIGAGRDIVNMAFFGQNLNNSDITRIVAGRDITATTQLENAIGSAGKITTTQESVVQGNVFVLGGPGSLMLEAGRNLGPFLTSATINVGGAEESFAGGVLAVGNTWNPNLAPQSASIYVEFGVAKGQDFNALSNYYLDPTNAANLPDYLFNETLNSNNIFVPNKNQPIYAPQLIAYMQAQQPAALVAAFGTTAVSYGQAYQVFAALPSLQQRPFLLQVYFSELSLTAAPGPTLDNYQRGYTAVNLLFPSSLGYTANNLTGGSNGANTSVHTGDLDLRLATIETQFGGNIDILGPGGRVLAGSTVATAQQAARRYSDAPLLYYGNPNTNGPSIVGGSNAGTAVITTIDSIPAGYEGVLTLRGGGISTFTDGDFVLNQSRLFTEQGGDIIMWSSNGDLNAGEGPKTSSNFPPVVVKIDADAFSQLDQSSSVTGAGIAGFEPAPGTPAPDVSLIAPRGTVDAGAAGVRFSGNLFIAALHVANADNFTNIGNGTAIGIPTNATANVSPQAAAASSAAVKAIQSIVGAQTPNTSRSVITVEVLGFGGD